MVIWQFDLANKKLRPTQAHLGQMKRITTNVLIDREDKFVYCGTTTGDLLQAPLKIRESKCLGGARTCSLQAVHAEGRPNEDVRTRDHHLGDAGSSESYVDSLHIEYVMTVAIYDM